MDPRIRIQRKSRKRTSGKTRSSLLHSVCRACLAFLCVVLLHQFLLAAFSIKMGYETVLTFSKVDSKPYDFAHWNYSRVQLLYGLPPFILFLSAWIVIYFMFKAQEVRGWYMFGFWWVVFSLLYVSAQLSIAPVSTAIGNGTLYQGIPVLVGYYGVSMYGLIALTVLSGISNVIFGFVAYRLLMQLSPSRTAVQSQQGKFKLVNSYYLLPLFIVFPVAVLLSYPHTIFFFGVMFLHGLLWLPGLYFIGYEYKGSQLRSERLKTGYSFIAVLVVLIVLIRVFM